MKQRKANRPGDLFRHKVAAAPAVPEVSSTYAARCTLSIVRGRVVAAWRIFKPQAKRGA